MPRCLQSCRKEDTAASAELWGAKALLRLPPFWSPEEKVAPLQTRSLAKNIAAHQLNWHSGAPKECQIKRLGALAGLYKVSFRKHNWKLSNSWFRENKEQETPHLPSHPKPERHSPPSIEKDVFAWPDNLHTGRDYGAPATCVCHQEKLSFGRESQADAWAQGQSGLQSKFQDSKSYTKKTLSQKTKKKNPTTTNKQKTKTKINRRLA